MNQVVQLKTPTRDEHVAILTRTLGKDEFMSAYAQLKALPHEDVVAVADAFNGPVPPSTTRSKALERIYSRHRKLVEF
jgi:hypothetical protein